MSPLCSFFKPFLLNKYFCYIILYTSEALITGNRSNLIGTKLEYVFVSFINFFSSPKTVQCLLDSGADINRPNVSGATPLYFACRYDLLFYKMLRSPVLKTMKCVLVWLYGMSVETLFHCETPWVAGNK